MNIYKKIAGMTALTLTLLFSASLQAKSPEYVLNFVSFYPGNLNLADVQGDDVPRGSQTQDVYVWGIPQTAKPWLLARVPLGSEMKLSWSDVNLKSIYFFNTIQAKQFESLARSGKTQNLIPNLSLFGGSRVVNYNVGAIPPSGSRLFAVPASGSDPNALAVVRSLPEVANAINALVNLVPSAQTIKQNPTASVVRKQLDRAQNMKQYAQIMNSKLPLLGIKDASVTAALNKLYTHYDNLIKQVPRPAAVSGAALAASIARGGSQPAPTYSLMTPYKR